MWTGPVLPGDDPFDCRGWTTQDQGQAGAARAPDEWEARLVTCDQGLPLLCYED